MRTEFEEELEHELAKLSPFRENETVEGGLKVTPKRTSIKTPPAQSREADFDTPPPSTAKCPVICFEHFHTPKTADPKKPGNFTSGALTLLTPVNPGFVDSSDELITDTSSTGLQTCLKKLITTKFPEFLAKTSRTSGTASAQDRLHIALVDLTGDKLSKPEFAGWGSTVAMYGASSPKILPLYAAFQLRADLRQMASKNKLSKGSDLETFAVKEWKLKKLARDFPDLNWLFQIRLWSGTPDTLDFTSDAREVFDKINENSDASKLIHAVGFPYIASLAWQSGLRHPLRGGLWVSRAYDGTDGWRDQPALKAAAFIHNLTPLSAATYFTLLAQGRLVDDSTSAEIRRILQFGCHSCLFPLVIGLDTSIGLQASKCGIFKPHIHDCVLIERPEVRYAAAILSELDATWPGWPVDPKCPTGKETSRYTELARALDALMVQNNKSPKSSCV